jgi:hypothetical protein
LDAAPLTIVGPSPSPSRLCRDAGLVVWYAPTRPVTVKAVAGSARLPRLARKNLRKSA